MNTNVNEFFSPPLYIIKRIGIALGHLTSSQLADLAVVYSTVVVLENSLNEKYIQLSIRTVELL